LSNVINPKLENSNPLFTRHFSYSIESIHISQVKFADLLVRKQVFKLLPKATQISSIRFEWLQLSDQALEDLLPNLAECKVLSFLSLTGNPIGDRGASLLSDFLMKSGLQISSLNLVDCSIGSEGIVALADGGLNVLNTLEVLHLDWNPIKNEGAAALANSNCVVHTLCNLSLGQCDISDEGILTLCQSIARSETMTWINLSWMKMGTQGADAVAAALELNPNLKNLYLTRNSIPNDGVLSIIESAAEFLNLRCLDLSQNDAYSTGAELMCEILEHPNCKIEHLNLSFASINDLGMFFLGQMLKENTSLTELYLDGNDCRGADGVRFLCEGIREGTNLILSDLRLGSCKINNEGAEVLEEFFRSTENCVISQLHLSGNNHIHDEVAEKLVDALETSFNIITSSYIPATDAQMNARLSKIFQRNSARILKWNKEILLLTVNKFLSSQLSSDQFDRNCLLIVFDFLPTADSSLADLEGLELHRF
jgi:Ran GTPase-activating protein 1